MSHEAITVSLTVYVSSVVVTAGAGWAVGRYESARSAEIKQLREAVNRLLAQNQQSRKGD